MPRTCEALAVAASGDAPTWVCSAVHSPQPFAPLVRTSTLRSAGSDCIRQLTPRRAKCFVACSGVSTAGRRSSCCSAPPPALRASRPAPRLGTPPCGAASAASAAASLRAPASEAKAASSTPPIAMLWTVVSTGWGLAPSGVTTGSTDRAGTAKLSRNAAGALRMTGSLVSAAPVLRCRFGAESGQHAGRFASATDPWCIGPASSGASGGYRIFANPQVPLAGRTTRLDALRSPRRSSHRSD